MNHKTALSQKGTNLAPLRDYDNPNCEADLIHLYDGFWDDVDWGVCYCPNCDQIICCVGGGVHWWNYTSYEPRQENLEKGRKLATSLHGEARQ